ncbi:uncharacterized protein K460DRAFT_82249 [Cucurbitaria berberidis CBS 394.84]|uniref:Uncharacterized protein n=1 Tax=Cucurbitaria berberidis CBS 394.84 TaxID=1168544 RepID=A0A9P4LBS1_9PLEO|nr:uncharacterized protein K460DRAFT_82249 [Cucurbitaria berberidis CBS 394.84]KAF1848888.1 hypothetical protein K460DRAFT_82249 [Cucurbitaria berberidis CBS 394.84]
MSSNDIHIDCIYFQQCDFRTSDLGQLLDNLLPERSSCKTKVPPSSSPPSTANPPVSDSVKNNFQIVKKNSRGYKSRRTRQDTRYKLQPHILHTLQRIFKVHRIEVAIALLCCIRIINRRFLGATLLYPHKPQGAIECHSNGWNCCCGDTRGAQFQEIESAIGRFRVFDSEVRCIDERVQSCDTAKDLWAETCADDVGRRRSDWTNTVGSGDCVGREVETFGLADKRDASEGGGGQLVKLSHC